MGVLERAHLEILRAVEEEGSLTAAAETLHLTQSALSHSMKKLEDLLGLALWHRQGRKLIPTQAGEYLLGVAQRLVPQFLHAETQLQRFSQGERGTLRIGIECHPCYQWLIKVAAPYLKAWPSVDLDVRQKFQFGGMGALFNHEIDLLVTPDPLVSPGISFTPVFDYEQVLVVGPEHPLRNKEFVLPEDLEKETLITYPVSPERLDIFTRFLIPGGIMPKRHKTIETTEILFLMVTSGRGVAALPRWMVEEKRDFEVFPLRLGKEGVNKQIFAGYRNPEESVDFLAGFLDLAAGLYVK